MKENNHKGAFSDLAHNASCLDSASPSKVPRNLVRGGGPSAVYVVSPTSPAGSEPLHQPGGGGVEGRLSEPGDISRF